jgi:glycosyltransferase involved in cell wall biosynthesis
VAPLLADTDVRVEVAGRGTSHLPGSDRVDFVGRVDDLATFLADAWVVGLPVRMGVGAPVKYVEALVTGVPVAATRDAVPDGGGGPAEPGVLVSDDPRAWADWVGRVVRDPDGVASLARDRRTAVLRERSWRAASGPLLEWVAGS